MTVNDFRKFLENKVEEGYGDFLVGAVPGTKEIAIGFYGTGIIDNDGTVVRQDYFELPEFISFLPTWKRKI